MNYFKSAISLIALLSAFSVPAHADFSSPSVAIISSAGIDAFAGTGVGSVLTRTLTGWKTLNCSSGQVMLFQGVGSNATCYTPTGTGTVTSVAATVPSFMSVSGSPVTAGGTLAFGFNSAAANTFLAAPSGSAGAPTMRGIVALDLGAGTLSPNFLSATIGNLTESGNSILSSGDLSLGASGSVEWNMTASAFAPSSDLGATLGTSLNRVSQVYAANIGASGSPVSNLYLNSPAATVYGNPTNATANGAPFTFQGLADVVAPSPTADWIPIYNAATGAIKKVNASELQTAVGGGVSSFNSRTGAVVPTASDYNTQQIVTLSNGAAPATGRIGEQIGAAFGSFAYPPATTTTLGSFTLTAGSWACGGIFNVTAGGSNVTGARAAQFNLSAATIGGGNFTVQAGGLIPSSQGDTMPLPTTYFNLSASTTIYLNGVWYLNSGTGNSAMSGAAICHRIA